MDKDEIKGKGQQGKGHVKEKIGEATHDTETEAEGKADRVAGKVREGFGKTKEAARDAADELKD